MEKLQKTMESTKWQKLFQKDNLIILVLAGLLLVVLSFPVKKEKEGVFQKEQMEMTSEKKVSGKAKFQELYDYAEYLEEKLESKLTNMEGVGRVKVMITLKASEEQIVEKDEPVIRDNTTETDSTGGNRVVYKMESGQETVFAKEGNNEIPYVSKTVLPQIAGVLIIAQGAGEGNNRQQIAEIVQVLFGVEAHKVKVVVME
ncbi:MAG: stage III sporulation protein AG [Lachnospiraceae bacterium]|nr:stage III sporulation protein AG [Lachnospiraceae bacterium]